MKKGRYQKAYRSFCRIRNTELIAARELYFAHCQILAEGAAFEGKSLLSRAVELFTIPRIRRASVASSWIVISQQFSGISIMVWTMRNGYGPAFYSILGRVMKSKEWLTDMLSGILLLDHFC